MKNDALGGPPGKFRLFGKPWLAEQSLDHLEAIRAHELGVVLKMMPPGGRLLEIGSGTGWQARDLNKRGYDVSAVDLPSSEYMENRVWPITEYDGKKIPFEDNAFDIVFSSNVLEHIPHVYEFQKEIHRVLKRGGFALHVLPSSIWRLWTNMAHIIKCRTMPRAHGTQAGNSLMEILYFSRRWWARLFRETGWEIVSQRSSRLFYTGHSIMDSRLSIRTRRTLSRILGTSSNIFFLRKKGDLP